jgi:hypothetical protein
MTNNLRETSGWIRKYSFSNPHTFVLEDLCLNLDTKVPEDWPFALEDVWLKPTVFVLESDHICAGRFVLESARKSSRILSIRAWRYVAESEHVRGGILGHSWQKLKWLNPLRAWIRICSPFHPPTFDPWHFQGIALPQSSKIIAKVDPWASRREGRQQWPDIHGPSF